ncbi:FAD-dependent oxidoreductase [Streptomyces capparidis]
MTPDDRDVILLAVSDSGRGEETARRLEEYFCGKYRVLRTSGVADTRKSLSALTDTPAAVAAVLAEEELPDGPGADLLSAEGRGVSAAPGLLLTPGAGPREAGRAGGGPRTAPASPDEEDFWTRVEEALYDAAGPGEHRAVVYGDRRKEKVFRVLRFLRLNHVAYRTDPVTVRGEVSVQVENYPKPLVDPPFIRLAELLGLVRMGHQDRYDLVVAGGGPAGLSAAVNGAALLGWKVLVVERSAPGGTAGTANNRIDNYLGFPDGIEPDELAHLWSRHAGNFHVEWLPASTVETIAASTIDKVPGYRITAKRDDGKTLSVEAKMLLLAGGHTPRAQGGKDENTYLYKGLYYDALPSDVDMYTGTDELVIIGAGDTAGRAAVFFAQKVKKVTMVILDTLGKSMLPGLVDEVRYWVKRGKVVLMEGYEVYEYAGADGYLTTVRVQKCKGGTDKQNIPVAGAYALIGGVPNTGWLKKLKTEKKLEVKLDVKGYVLTGPAAAAKQPMETSLSGVFAAGDIRSGAVRRISAAVGEGGSAVLSMLEYMKDKKITVEGQPRSADALFMSG